MAKQSGTKAKLETSKHNTTCTGKGTTSRDKRAILAPDWVSSPVNNPDHVKTVTSSQLEFEKLSFRDVVLFLVALFLVVLSLVLQIVFPPFLLCLLILLLVYNWKEYVMTSALSQATYLCVVFLPTISINDIMHFINKSSEAAKDFVIPFFFNKISASMPPPPASDSTRATTCQHFSEFLKFVGNVVSSSTRRGLGVLTILGGVYTAKVNIPLLVLLILYGIGLLTEAQELGIICPPRNRDEAIERTTWNPRNVRASKLRGKIDRGTSRPSKLFARVVFNATGYLSCVALYALYAGLTGASNSIEPTSV